MMKSVTSTLIQKNQNKPTKENNKPQTRKNTHDRANENERPWAFCKQHTQVQNTPFPAFSSPKHKPDQITIHLRIS